MSPGGSSRTCTSAAPLAAYRRRCVTSHLPRVVSLISPKSSLRPRVPLSLPLFLDKNYDQYVSLENIPLYSPASSIFNENARLLSLAAAHGLFASGPPVSYPGKIGDSNQTAPPPQSPSTGSGTAAASDVSPSPLILHKSAQALSSSLDCDLDGHAEDPLWKGTAYQPDNSAKSGPADDRLTAPASSSSTNMRDRKSSKTIGKWFSFGTRNTS